MVATAHSRLLAYIQTGLEAEGGQGAPLAANLKARSPVSASSRPGRSKSWSTICCYRKHTGDGEERGRKEC